MRLAQMMAEDRRLILLRAMHEVPGYTLNQTICGRALEQFGHGGAMDTVRAELSWLEEQALVQVNKLSRNDGSDFWVATLTNRGIEVAEGRANHPGVSRRAAD